MQGKPVRLRPLRCYYLPFQEIPCHQVLIAVPKKYCKQAVQRNKLKRRIREAYRTMQQAIAPALLGQKLLLGYVYVGSEATQGSYAVISKAMAASIQYLQKQFIPDAKVVASK